LLKFPRYFADEQSDTINMSGQLTTTVRGIDLVRAIIWAQAKTIGGPAKLAAGAGILDKYLGENPVGKTAWESRSRLKPAVIIARSCLNSADREMAGTFFEQVIEPDQLEKIYFQVLAPHFAGGKIDPAVVNTRLPEEDLVMLRAPGNKLVISQSPISYFQFDVFIAQNEEAQTDSFPDLTRRAGPVTWVAERYAQAFAGWLGMSVPLVDQLAAAPRFFGKKLIKHGALDEWTGTVENGWPQVFSWATGDSYSAFPQLVELDRVTFRVARR
jgi:hypothetical protein